MKMYTYSLVYMVYIHKRKCYPGIRQNLNAQRRNVGSKKKRKKKRNNEHKIHLLIQADLVIWVMLFTSQRGGATSTCEKSR